MSSVIASKTLKGANRALTFTALVAIFITVFQPVSNAANFNVIYSANANQFQTGATTGTLPITQNLASGATVTVAANSGNLARAGFTFYGWNTLSNGQGTHYDPGQTFTLGAADTTLYAEWTIPLSARLMGQSGSLVTFVNTKSVTNGTKCVANVRGITSDGNYIYFRPNSDGGYICKVGFTGVVEEAINIGTSLSAITIDQMALTYANGCIFIRPDGGANTTLNCIDLSDRSFTSIALPVAKPLFAGKSWLLGNLITFPDGRVGAVSQPNQSLPTGTGAGQCPSGLYCKILRLYTLANSGKSTTFTWSEDIILADNTSTGWPTDDHGIATDGTYLYQVNYNSGYKVYSLASGSPSYLVFDGVGGSSCNSISPSYCPINTPNTGLTMTNATYIGRSHLTNQYLIGDYDATRFWLSGSVAPPQGPGSVSPAAPTLPQIIGNAYKGVNTTVTISTTAAAKVAFYFDGKRIPQCQRVATTGSSPTYSASCTWKPSVTAFHKIYAIVTPTNPLISVAQSGVATFFILKRATLR
jgi:uncharacterized repeat protein (TIGR02543 family)